MSHDDVLPHISGHELPITTGYGYVGLGPESKPEVSVWCGRCQGVFRPDADWAMRYFASQHYRLDGLLERGRITRGQHLDATDQLAEERDRLLRILGVPA